MAQPRDGSAARPANKRGVARLAAVQALYQMDIAGTPVDKIVNEFENVRFTEEIDGAQLRDADPAFFRSIIAGVIAEQKTIDPQIHLALTSNWPLTRVDSILRAILRSGCFELMKKKDVPAKVVISEYLDVANAFFEGEVPAVVNGVLNRLASELRPDEMAQSAS